MSRRADTPCAGCGKLLWGGRGSKSAGERMCLECRASRVEHGTRQGYRERGCRCVDCVTWNRDQDKRYRAERRAQGRPVRHFGSSGPWIAESVRLTVFERDGWICQLCGDPLDRDSSPNGDWYPSVDHVVPRSKGGTHEATNLRAAHRWCNSVRGSEEYHSELFEVAR